MRRLLLIACLALVPLAPIARAAGEPPPDNGGGHGEGHDCEHKKEPVTS